MGVTSTYSLPYPEPTDAPDGPAQIEALAEAVEDEIVRIDAALLVDGRIPGQRIAVATSTSDSATFTSTESGSLLSVTAPLVDGRTYAVELVGRMGADTAAQVGITRMRQASAAGTEVGSMQTYVHTTSSVGYGPVLVRGEIVAAGTGNVAFHVTGQRNGGSGNMRLVGSAASPLRLEVRYVAG